jgi:hypothetical protein
MQTDFEALRDIVTQATGATPPDARVQDALAVLQRGVEAAISQPQTLFDTETISEKNDR